MLQSGTTSLTSVECAQDWGMFSTACRGLRGSCLPRPRGSCSIVLFRTNEPEQKHYTRRNPVFQLLPSAAATHVRNKNPGTSNETPRMADLFFQDRLSSPDNLRWLRRPSQKRKEHCNPPPHRHQTPQYGCNNQ